MRLLSLILFLSTFSLAQQDKTKNYRKFDERIFHFGFMLGGNTSNFRLIPNFENYSNYQLKSIELNPQPGGQVGIISSMKIFTPVLRLRFIPTLSFQERALVYRYVNPDPQAKSDILNEERVNSTNLDFPMMLQFRTLRYNNFTSYILGGMQYSRDLQTKENSSQSFIDPFLKIKANDWQTQVGAGIEFFAPYFKFSFEVKFSQGIGNSFIQDNTPSSKPINQLFNRVTWFSLVFEG